MAQIQQGQVVSLATTVGSRDDARRLAAGLVEQRLAACVQVDPSIESHYRWEGRQCVDAEVRLVAKTTAQRLPALLAWLQEHHPYDLPQLVWQEVQASQAYADWVASEVADG